MSTQNFEAGDLIRMKTDCSDCVRGLDYILDKDQASNKLYTLDSKGRVSCTCQDKWDLIKKHNQPNPIRMNKLNSLVKRLLDKDVQTLVKAGFLDKELRLTTDGKEALDGLLFLANKADLVKLAEEVLEEEKEG